VRHVFRRDLGKTWTVSKNPKFPDGSDRTFFQTWHIEPGHASTPNVVWAGTEPTALFKSEDRGETWTLNKALDDVPSRKEWVPGFGGMGPRGPALERAARDGPAEVLAGPQTERARFAEADSRHGKVKLAPRAAHLHDDRRTRRSRVHGLARLVGDERVVVRDRDFSRIDAEYTYPDTARAKNALTPRVAARRGVACLGDGVGRVGRVDRGVGATVGGQPVVRGKGCAPHEHAGRHRGEDPPQECAA
jgi:hypothetical protein